MASSFSNCRSFRPGMFCGQVVFGPHHDALTNGVVQGSNWPTWPISPGIARFRPFLPRCKEGKWKRGEMEKTQPSSGFPFFPFPIFPSYTRQFHARNATTRRQLAGCREGSLLPADARGLSDEGRRRPGDLRGQGEEPAGTGGQLLPEGRGRRLAHGQARHRNPRHRLPRRRERDRRPVDGSPAD